MRNIFVAATIFPFLCFQSLVFSQPFTLVKDINPGRLGLGVVREPVNLTESNGSIFFNIQTSGAPNGLWKSDGTEEGTVRFEGFSADKMINVNGTLFFINGSAFCKSDGTQAGTEVVKTFSYKADNLTNVNGKLYFTVDVAKFTKVNDSVTYVSYDKELWKSDGTEGGTEAIKEFSYVQNMVAVGDLLFFSANESAAPDRDFVKLWKSDGTPGGTLLVKDIYTGSWNANSPNFFNANGVLYFLGWEDTHGAELWKSDGTEAGTVLIKDIEPGSDGITVSSFCMLNNNAYFFAKTPANVVGFWKTDGTAAGTLLVKDMGNFNPPSSLIRVNNTLFFSAYDNSVDRELWKSDGTTAGNVIVKNINRDGSSFPRNLIDVNGVLYFFADDNSVPGCYENQGGLWKTDGTETGTILIKRVYGGNYYAQANGTLFFTGTDALYGAELWKSDGTAEGTIMVKDIIPTGGSRPKKFTAMNGITYFIGFEDPGVFYVRGEEVYQTNGTLCGTQKTTSINGMVGSYPKEIVAHKGELFLSANDGYHGYELWKSNGLPLTSGGGGVSTMVKDINPGNGSNPSHLTSIGQSLFFAANDGTNGNELWKSDGTREGTVMVKDINPNGNSNPANLLNLNGVLYFTADNGTDGIELWKSNGTDAGTVMVKNIRAGSGNSNPANLTAVNGVLYFVADDGVNGIELWKSDGTVAGTVLVKNINTGTNNSSPAVLTNVNGVLYFAADDGINGVEVWKSNGTEAGTVLVKDIYNGPPSSNPNLFTNFNGIVLFAADDGISGRELWGSNGSASGTILIKDIQPGSIGSNPTALKRVGGCVLFAANDGVHGNEVWLSAGTESGTRLMSEIESGITGSDPTEIFEYGSKVLVAATNAMVGGEVWIANVPADIPQLVATITAEGPVTICTGKNVSLKTNRGVGYTYQWKRGGVNIAGATQSNYTATISGYYTVVIKDAFGASSTSETVIVTVVNPPLSTVAAAGPLTFCFGKNVLLKASSGAGYTYQWKKTGVNINNATLSTYTATAAGAYSVVVTNATGCSATSAVLNVTVNNMPLATVAAAGPLTFCQGRTVQLKAILGAGYTYQWKRGGAAIAGATSSNYTASATGYYTVIVTNAAGCSATSAALTVVVKPLPIATITATGPTSLCSGKSVLLKANSGTNYTYKWIRGATAIPGAVQSNFSATQPGWYTVTVTNASGCSVTSAAIAVSVNPLPVATITPGGPLTFCAGQNVVLKANTGISYTYQWKKAGVNITGATQVNYTATASGVYSVVVTNAAGCPVTSAAVTVTVNNVPLANIAAATSTTFCSGKSVLLKAITGAGYTYQWKKNGVNIPSQTQSNYTATATGLYTVAVTNALGCSTLSIAINVTVVPLPAAIITANGPLTFPQGGNVILNASAGTGNTYQWKKDGVNLTGATTQSYAATASGSYTVAITNSNGCQAISQPTVVTVTQSRPVTKGFAEEEEMIRVYPNPLYRNDYVNIDWNIIGADNGVVVNVYDITGKRINSQRLRPGDGTVKVKGASGVYLVELRWGVNKRKVFRVVKIE